jgi:hypothetical protein
MNAHRHYAPSRIRTHDPSFRADEESSCLRPRAHCDRLNVSLLGENIDILFNKLGNIPIDLHLGHFRYIIVSVDFSSCEVTQFTKSFCLIVSKTTRLKDGCTGHNKHVFFSLQFCPKPILLRKIFTELHSKCIEILM